MDAVEFYKSMKRMCYSGEMLYVQPVMQFLSLLIIFVRTAAKGW